MIVDAGFLTQWNHKGHELGTCMSHPDSDLMYVNIPKNASSWTKPNLTDWGWEFYNYHRDNLNKTSIVVLRDPVERWCSGIAEYLYLYHPDMRWDELGRNFYDVVFDRICFDDHTERQVNFIHGLDTDRCIFLKFGPEYRNNFSQLLAEHNMPNRYFNYEPQHVSDNSRERKHAKLIFTGMLNESKYLTQVQDYYEADYKLINSVHFYGRN
jgi:hypothetical protein